MGESECTLSSGCEQLHVYQHAQQFLDYREKVLGNIHPLVAACDHLLRASESIPLNIAHGAAARSPKERGAHYGYACGSALECAACLDVLATKRVIEGDIQTGGKKILREIVSMLVAMQKIAANRLREEPAQYGAPDQKVYFDHERLQAYKSALTFIAWMTEETLNPSCSADLRTKLDRASTSVVLNIAEGNGRFSNADKIKFFHTAERANAQLTALLDIAFRKAGNVDQGRAILTTTGRLLTGLIKSKAP